MQVRSGDGRIWMTGTDREVREAANALEAVDFVARVAIVPEHDEVAGHVPAELYAEVTR